MQNNKWCVSLVCTEIACHWNKSTEKIARPCKISDLFVTKNPRTKQRDKKYREDLKSFNPWIEGHRNLNKEKFGNFLTKIKNVNQNVFIFQLLDNADQNEINMMQQILSLYVMIFFQPTLMPLRLTFLQFY